MLASGIAGVLLGFVGSVPVAGPIAVLVVARGLEGRRQRAFLIACGAAVAEATYAFLAYRGFSAFLADLPWITHASRGVAVLLLTAIGLGLLRRRGGAAPVPEPHPQIGSSVGLGFAISALNPTFLATWTAAVAAISTVVALDTGTGAAVAFGIGTALGITAWFALALAFLARLRAGAPRRALARCHRCFGWLVLGLAVAMAFAFVGGLDAV